MKSVRRVFLGNQQYHHNLLGKEFDALVEEATEKLLSSPNEEANRNVILAINDPNTGMQLTPHKISHELRKHLRLNIPRKQWLTTVLIGDVLRECRPHVQSVSLELLEAVSALASASISTTGQSLRNAKEAAVEILREHGHGPSSQPPTPPTPTDDASFTDQKEPRSSLSCIDDTEQSCRNHCEVVRSMLLGNDTPYDLVRELIQEIKHMRSMLIASVERLVQYSGSRIDIAISKAFEAVDAADAVLQLRSKIRSGEMKELTTRDLPRHHRSTSDVTGMGIPKAKKKEKHQRPISMDIYGLDSLEEGLRQSTPVTPASDPFQILAERGSPQRAPSDVNPFADSNFTF